MGTAPNAGMQEVPVMMQPLRERETAANIPVTSVRESMTIRISSFVVRNELLPFIVLIFMPLWISVNLQ
jgi:hypothetical protein